MWADDDKPDPTLNERIIQVPVSESISLEVTIMTPDGNGPFPLAILNHGKSFDDPKTEPRYRSAYIGRYFLSRGYLVVLPMMRGFARSDGTFTVPHDNFRDYGLQSAEDISAVIRYVSNQPNIDASRIVVSGQSMGGWNTLAFGSLGYPGVKGIINFSGGMHDTKGAEWRAQLIEAAGYYGSKTKIPSLWFYGDNDSLFDSPLFHSMHANYIKNGASATLIDYGVFGSDSHNMLGSLEGFPIWISRVDDFLVALGLPGKLKEARYLPAVPPPPSHFAAIGDLQAVPFLDDKGRQDYQDFLKAELPRVFFITPKGGSASFDGGYDPLSRGRAALATSAPDAQLYAVDNDVVWQPGPAPLSPTTPVADSKETAGWRILAANGDINSMRHLGFYYLFGYCVPINLTEASKWIVLAAEKGDPLARGLELQYGLSGNTRDLPKAEVAYREGASQNDELAMIQLFKVEGSNTTSIADAITWLRKSADAGSPIAQTILGELYFKGQGVTRDYAQSLKWYQSAAAQGFPDAQNNIGYAYLNGLGVTQDYSIAQSWFQKAASQGLAASQNELGNMSAKGQGAPKDFVQAMVWYREAADQGFKTAQYNVGYLTEHGLGASEDVQKAREWYEKAAAQNCPPAAAALIRLNTH